MVRERPRSFRIRRAREEDVPAILRCLRDAFEPYRLEYSSGAFIDTVLNERSALRRLRSMRVLVAVEPTGDVIGSIAWGRESETTGHLRGMSVVPHHQGTGVAQALLDRAIRELARNGFTRVTLDTTSPLHRAVRFYEKNGFQPSGRVSDFFGMPLTEWSKQIGKDSKGRGRDKPLRVRPKRARRGSGSPNESRKH